MIYPLKNWKTLRRGYKFRAWTFYGTEHLGLDVVAPQGMPILAWQDLEIVHARVGKEGGNTAWIKCPNNKRLFRIMHLQKPARIGKYKEGQVIAHVGNTGSLSRGAHVHLDISKNGILDVTNFGNFEDPENYFKQFVKIA
jgi:murein DD-endopeptidase MepM/ murein hydrolase activator NlpD